jgi:hypothetical protein
MNERDARRNWSDATLASVVTRMRRVPGQSVLVYPHGFSIRLTEAALDLIERSIEVRADDRGLLFAVPKKKAPDEVAASGGRIPSNEGRNRA